MVKELLAVTDELGSPAPIEAVFCFSICTFFFLLIVFVLILFFPLACFPLLLTLYNFASFFAITVGDQ